MQKQKLLNCRNRGMPDLFKANRFVFLSAGGETNAEAPKQAKILNKTGENTPDDAKAKGINIVQNKTDTMNILEATSKVTKSVDYLIKKQKLAIDYDKFLDMLKDKKFLAQDFKQEQLNADVAVAEAIKTMQRDLGFKGADVDGIIGKNTFAAVGRRPEMLLALVGAQYPHASALAKKSGEPPVEKKAEVKEKRDLPADAKPKIEAELSNISDAIQMNYKTVANLHGKLFNADGTFIQPTNATDLMGYKAALDNISGQIKIVNKIGNGLGEYKVPDDFTLTITNQSGDTAIPRILRCDVHNEFFVPKAGLFAVNEGRGAVSFRAYNLMQENFEKRLAELKSDYDHAVQEWAQKLAGKEGLTGDDASIAKFDEVFGAEHVPPVLALLGKKTEDFQADVLSEAGTVLATRKAARDKQLAQNP